MPESAVRCSVGEVLEMLESLWTKGGLGSKERLKYSAATFNQWKPHGIEVERHDIVQAEASILHNIQYSAKKRDSAT